jgi:hypothetical protein
VIAPRALGVVESTVVDDEKTVTFATSGAARGAPECGAHSSTSVHEQFLRFFLFFRVLV